jgi:hypothetical protein
MPRSLAMKKLFAVFMLLAFLAPDVAWATYSCFGTTAPCPINGIQLGKKGGKSKKSKKHKKSKKTKHHKKGKHAKKTKHKKAKHHKAKHHGTKKHARHITTHAKHHKKSKRQHSRAQTQREEPLTIVRDLPPVTAPETIIVPETGTQAPSVTPPSIALPSTEPPAP